MIPTERDLQVARAVRDACYLAVPESSRDAVDLLDLAAVIAALPEAAPLPAPTGPVKPAVESCNMHRDCRAAEEAARLAEKTERYGAGSRRLEHCNDDCCEDCFGC